MIISKDLLIFGAGSHARKVALAFKRRGHIIRGFITSDKDKKKYLDGIPLFSWNNLPVGLTKNSQLVCAIFNRSDAYDNLSVIAQPHSDSRLIWPWDYYPYLHEELGWCYWLDPNPRIGYDWDKDDRFTKLMSILEDDESRTILQRVLSFRHGNDIEFASYKSSDPQYFNQLTLRNLPDNKPVSYLDIGAYNGDTLKVFTQVALIGRAALIEPDPYNFACLTASLVSLSSDFPSLRPVCLPVGAGISHSSFFMNGEGESVALNRVSECNNSGDRFATVVPIDDVFIREDFDFVKVDAEGNDLEAVLGMKKILWRSQPILAVSLYHKPADILDIPVAIIESLRGLRYKYYIRQHMYNTFDSVLYAIPGRFQ